MYEHVRKPPLSRHQFARRLLRHVAAAALLLALSLVIGMWGYGHYEHLSWVDGFLNASMLLGGMGPVNNPVTVAGKLFAGCYALYAGLVFIFGSGIILAPLLHRMLHAMHCDEQDR